MYKQSSRNIKTVREAHTEPSTKTQPHPLLIPNLHRPFLDQHLQLTPPPSLRESKDSSNYFHNRRQQRNSKPNSQIISKVYLHLTYFCISFPCLTWVHAFRHHESLLKSSMDSWTLTDTQYIQPSCIKFTYLVKL